jgi:hypothetical protein
MNFADNRACSGVTGGSFRQADATQQFPESRVSAKEIKFRRRLQIVQETVIPVAECLFQRRKRCARVSRSRKRDGNAHQPLLAVKALSIRFVGQQPRKPRVSGTRPRLRPRSRNFFQPRQALRISFQNGRRSLFLQRIRHPPGEPVQPGQQLVRIRSFWVDGGERLSLLDSTVKLPAV